MRASSRRLRLGFALLGICYLASCGDDDADPVAPPDAGARPAVSLLPSPARELDPLVSSPAPEPRVADFRDCQSALDLERGECGVAPGSEPVECNAGSSPENGCDQRFIACSDGSEYRITCATRADQPPATRVACGCLIDGKARGTFSTPSCPTALSRVNEGCAWNLGMRELF